MNKLYSYSLFEKYQYDGTRDNIYFVIASSLEEAKRKLKPVSNSYVVYSLEECDLNELKELLK